MKSTFSITIKILFRLGLTVFLELLVSRNLHAQTAPSKLWDKAFGGNYADFIHAMDATSDGGFIIGGTSWSGISGDKSEPTKGGFDYWIVKVDANGNKQWDKTYGGDLSNELTAIQQTSDGGYIVGGRSRGSISFDKSEPSRGLYDYWILKLDQQGNKVWDKTYGGSDHETLQSIQQTIDGGYIVGGTSFSDVTGDKSQPSKGMADFWILKLDSSGNKIWDKSIGGNKYDQHPTVKQTADGGYIVGGTSISDISGDKTQPSLGSGDYWVVKLDAFGNKIWDKTFGGSLYDEAYIIMVTSDNNYIIGGTSSSGIGNDKTQASKGKVDFWIIKLDTLGNKIWDLAFGGADDDDLGSIQQTSDKGFILAGVSTSGISGDKTESHIGDNDIWIVKIDSIGNKEWDKTLGTSGQEYIAGARQTYDGGYLLAGGTDSGIDGDKSQPSQGDFDYWIIKLGGSIVGLKESQPAFKLFITPNPNQGKFKLQLNNLIADKVEVAISDVLGREILIKDFSIINQQLSEELTFPAAKGMYLLQVKAGNEITSRKIIVE